MNDAWNQTQAKLKKWQRVNPTGWELRRILSDSQYFKIIALCAYLRTKNPPKHIAWQDWWAFYLERLSEKEAIKLLLDVWNKDVWAHLNYQAKISAQTMLYDIAEQTRLSQEISLALNRVITDNVENSFLNGQN